MSFKSFLYACPLISIYLMVIWSYYSYIVFALFKVVILSNKIMLLIFYNILVIMFMWSLSMAAFMNLSQPPSQYQVSARDHTRLLSCSESDRNNVLQNFCYRTGLQIYTRSQKGYIRYCGICQQIKPDRAHHCSECKICVLKMDHHCPWINNCVGYSNYKSFILMLFYGCSYCFFVGGTTLQYSLKVFSHTGEHINFNNIQILIVCLVCLAFGTILICFFGYHLNLLLKNETTLESMSSPIFIENGLTFNRGICQNLVDVFGEVYLLWLIPTKCSDADKGSTFQVNTKTENV